MSASNWSLMEMAGNNKEVSRPKFFNPSAIMTLAHQRDPTIKKANKTTAVHPQRYFQ